MMRPLYQIDTDIESCINEDGEIIDIDRLEELQIERDQKLEGVALWVKNLTAEAEALKAEKLAFAQRQSAAKKKINQLKRYLVNATFGEPFETSRVKVTFRSSESVDVTDLEKIPQVYLRAKVEPDKTALKEALKNGEQIEGAELVKNRNIQIK